MTSRYTKNNTSANHDDMIHTITTHTLIILAIMGIVLIVCSYGPDIAIWMEKASALTPASIELH